MDRDSVDRLRFDRRLQRRKDWLDESERDAHLASLPDVSEKMTTCAEEEDGTDDNAVASAPEADRGAFSGFGSDPNAGSSIP